MVSKPGQKSCHTPHVRTVCCMDLVVLSPLSFKFQVLCFSFWVLSITELDHEHHLLFLQLLQGERKIHTPFLRATEKKNCRSPFVESFHWLSPVLIKSSKLFRRLPEILTSRQLPDSLYFSASFSPSFSLSLTTDPHHGCSHCFSVLIHHRTYNSPCHILQTILPPSFK